MDHRGPPLAVTFRRRLAGGAAAAVPLVFVALFFAYPLATILSRGLFPDGALDLGPVGNVFSDPVTRHIVWFTIWQAALSTVLTLVIALPGAYCLARFRFPGRRLVRAAITVPFVLPTVMVGTAFLSLGFQPSLGAVIVAHVFFNYAVVARVVGELWSHLDPRDEEAARLLGASRIRAFTEVTLPTLRPAIIAAATITFLFTFTSFGVILVLGGPTRSTIETEIFRATTRFLDLPAAAALSVVQLAAVVALLLVIGRLERRNAALSLRAARETARTPRGRGEWLFLGANFAVMGALLFSPLAVLLVRSFRRAGAWSFANYHALGTVHAGSVLFVSPWDALGNSVLFALAATAIAVTIGLLAATVAARSRRRFVEGALALPLGVSAVTLGFGFLIALDAPPLDLRTSWWLVPIAQALVALPFVVRVTVPMLRSIDPRWRDAASVLGASPWRVRREVDLPIVARAVAVAAGFAMAISLGEFGATAFLARPDRPTLPVVVYRLLGQPGTVPFGAAVAASCILLVVTAATFLACDRARVGDLGGF